MKAAYTPLRISIWWLTGTFVLFLVVGEVGRVPDMFKLVSFVTCTITVFAVGYWLRVKTWKPSGEVTADDTQSIRFWVVASALYAGLFGLALLLAYGATSPGQVIDAALHPGAAYFFRLRDAQLDAGNGLVQTLTLGAALTTPVVPFTIIYWERLTLAIRALVVVGVLLYCSYWLFIGTQKGLGDYASFAVIALLARAAMNGRGLSRRVVAGIAVVAMSFGLYMVFNQSDRLDNQQQQGAVKPNPIAAAVVGDDLARGVTTTLFYPTHGYLGLSYNLDTPFKWAHMRGSSRAFDSYWVQYVGGTTAFPDTYPARTQQLSGWPALTYWATIYPWLASDLTWPGAVAVMGLVGWWLAQWWLEAVYLRRKLALLLVGQMAILIAYVPANNQLGITRPGLIAFVTLLGLYFLGRVNAAISRRRVHVVNPDQQTFRSGSLDRLRQ